MLPSLTNGTTIPLLQQVAKFAERRQDVIAGNIANASTPDYRMRDLPVAKFQEALGDAVAGRTETTSLGTQWSFQAATKPAPVDPFSDELFQAVEAEPQGVTFHDGNNRSIEHQMMEMTKNSLLYNSAVELMKVQFNRLQAIVAERP
jgi:flagellar basal-body rod protein FlgB